MAFNYFIGNLPTALIRAQVDTLTVGGTVEANDVFSVTLEDENGNTSTLDVVAGSTAIATVCTNIAAAFNASVDPRFTAITAAAGATTVTLTADTPGVPFVCTVATTENGGGGADAQTFTQSTTTTNRGANDYGTALNWSLGIVPVATNDVVIDGRQVAHIYYGLNRSSVDLASFTRYQTNFAVGQASAPLRIRSAVIKLNVPPTDGLRISVPALTNIDAGNSEASTIDVYGGYSQGTNGRENVCVKHAHASGVLNVYAGTVGACTNNPSDTGEFATVNVKGGSAKAILGSGLATLPALTLRDGASAIVRCAVTALDSGTGCSVTTEGAGAIGTLTCDGPTVINSTGAITNLHMESNARVDTTQTSNARTISNAFGYGAFTLKTDLLTTYSAGIDCLRGAKTTQVDGGDGVTVGLTAA